MSLSKFYQVENITFSVIHRTGIVLLHKDRVSIYVITERRIIVENLFGKQAIIQQNPNRTMSHLATLVFS